MRHAKPKKLRKNFFARDAAIVARQLLGKILVRKFNKKFLKTRIVETEAYYGKRDPASRARQNGSLRAMMLEKPGTLLVYGVHNNWLLNIVTGRKGKAQAVLIRAVEPLNFGADTKGPGKLTAALHIGKEFHGVPLGKEIFICEDGKLSRNKIAKSKRIGVKQDLEKPLRFFIKGNMWVSKNKQKV